MDCAEEGRDIQVNAYSTVRQQIHFTNNPAIQAKKIISKRNSNSELLVTSHNRQFPRTSWVLFMPCFNWLGSHLRQ